MSPKAKERSKHLAGEAGLPRVVRGDRPERAPTEPEYRTYPVSPAPTMSAEAMVAEMVANDPEWEQMLFEQRHGVLY